ncbi:MAG TPA: hypothetical protein VMF55_16155 [Solirubrobacterales bacterium]|nr:hypothetical protein [Solirubrobacterales bacterium]
MAKLTYANVMATVAVFIALGGVSYAAFKLPRNSVGAKQLRKGAVTPAKLSAASVSALTGAPGPQGPQGPAGPPGPQGPQGNPGTPATSLLASVSADGKLLSGSEVTEAGQIEKAYEVKFDRDVSDCIYAVDLASPGAKGFTVAYSDEEDGSGVIVETADKAGSGETQAFYLAVLCP